MFPSKAQLEVINFQKINYKRSKQTALNTFMILENGFCVDRIVS